MHLETTENGHNNTLGDRLTNNLKNLAGHWYTPATKYHTDVPCHI